MSKNDRTQQRMTLVFAPSDAEQIRAELGKHHGIIAERLDAIFGPLRVYGPSVGGDMGAAPTGNVIDIFTGKAIQ